MSIKQFITKELNFEDVDDEYLIEELEERGYNVDYNNSRLEGVFWEYSRGNIKEALYQLEIVFPELKGISNAKK